MTFIGERLPVFPFLCGNSDNTGLTTLAAPNQRVTEDGKEIPASDLKWNGVRFRDMFKRWSWWSRTSLPFTVARLSLEQAHAYDTRSTEWGPIYLNGDEAAFMYVHHIGADLCYRHGGADRVSMIEIEKAVAGEIEPYLLLAPRRSRLEVGGMYLIQPNTIFWARGKLDALFILPPHKTDTPSFEPFEILNRQTANAKLEALQKLEIKGYPHPLHATDWKNSRRYSTFRTDLPTLELVTLTGFDEPLELGHMGAIVVNVGLDTLRRSKLSIGFTGREEDAISLKQGQVAAVFGPNLSLFGHSRALVLC